MLKRLILGARVILLLAALAVLAPGSSFSEVKLSEGESYVLEAASGVRTDFFMLENTVDLDTKQRDDRVEYIGLDYRFEFDFRMKDESLRLFVNLERNGFYDYDAPIVINNTLNTFLGKVGGYTNYELLPKVKDYWGDMRIVSGPDIRIKGGLFKYEVGHGISLNGSYQNYGIELYTETEGFRWNVYTCWPDIANKQLLGPYITQEKPQMVDYEHSKSYFLSTDMKVSHGGFSLQPYVGLLMDFSIGKRQNVFLAPTDNDTLGTVGISSDFTFGKLKLSAEWARNFGRAESTQAGLADVEHMGYAVYADAQYDLGKFTPRALFVYGSGNELTTDMITNGDTHYTGSKNCAFSVYSPMNTYLADSVYPGIPTLPLLAMGNGLAMNYGVRRASTFNDPAQIENLTLVDVGFDYKFSDKFSVNFDWWYLATSEKGIGMYNNVPKVISPDLGNEIDLYADYFITKNILFSVAAGAFFPGAAYREERTDATGSLFTPFVRGDGKADPAYQLEISMELQF